MLTLLDKDRKTSADWNRRLRKSALDILGNKCILCGFDDYRALQVDHIEGNGSSEYKHSYGGTYWRRVIESVLKKENKYQLLCANCNWIKRYNGKETLGRPRTRTN